MRYIYDGTLEGLLTAVFATYSFLEQIHIEVKGRELSFFDTFTIPTNEEKAKRVKKGIIENFGYGLYDDITRVFCSYFLEKEDAIAQTIKGCYQLGPNYLTSSNKAAVDFLTALRNVNGENHKYKGLLRFSSIQDDFLFAQFEPKNDILELLTPHFVRRMPKEKFIIYDYKRGKASLSYLGEWKVGWVEDIDIQDSEEEIFFKEAWIKFYHAIGIEERKNEKLMMKNMPKRYWKYLAEKKGAE